MGSAQEATLRAATERGEGPGTGGSYDIKVLSHAQWSDMIHLSVPHLFFFL